MRQGRYIIPEIGLREYLGRSPVPHCGHATILSHARASVVRQLKKYTALKFYQGMRHRARGVKLVSAILGACPSFLSNQ